MKTVVEYLILLALFSVIGGGMLHVATVVQSHVCALYLATAGITMLAIVWHHPLSLLLTMAEDKVNGRSATASRRTLTVA